MSLKCSEEVLLSIPPDLNCGNNKLLSLKYIFWSLYITTNQYLKKLIWSNLGTSDKNILPSSYNEWIKILPQFLKSRFYFGTGPKVHFLPFQKFLRETAILMHRKILSPFPYGIGFSTQTTLSGVVQNQILDKKGFKETVLMELSKAFDILNRELLLAKLMLTVFIKIHWK